MVVIQIKNSEYDTFLYETTCNKLGDEVLREITKIWNLRLRLQQLAQGIRELAAYGPMKPLDKAGIDSIQEESGGVIIEKGEFYQQDPTGIRTGNGPGPRLSETLDLVANDAEALLSKDNVTRKIAITLNILQEKLDNIRGAVTMAYPMGLPTWDTIRLTIEGIEGISGTPAGQQILDENTSELWIASRCLDRNQVISDRFGKNEKTKVIGKLQRPGAGAPGREPVVSEEEKKAMMAYYFKKQEELKQLAENSEDDYLNSSWADSKQLQKSLRGSGNIRAPGIR
eukprot:gene19287-25147_t